MSTVACVIYKDMWAFDYGVAVEVWGIHRSDTGGPQFDFRRCSVDGQPVNGHAGTTIRATHDLAGLDSADLILAPGRDNHTDPLDPAIGLALRAAHRRGAQIVGLCGGAFTLAQAGLLDGRRATTHWLLADDLRRLHPKVVVEQKDLYIEDSGIWTSAGTASIIDLCLHLVRTEHGAKFANTIARRMVTPPHRAGNQRPYIENPLPLLPAKQEDPIQHAMGWALHNLDLRQTTSQLAQQAHMSERTFIRQFTKSTGSTPQSWLLHQRLLHAQHLLEATELTVQVIAERAGFNTAPLLRRHFKAFFANTPSEYRLQFSEIADRTA